ncbi:hypothetical protein AnigIFM59636_003675 [Aspergillus niger]|uniref:uncharacterized protein n=1 Tax=Aspergillus lacticoffeatus (strain CBS 101883) TaxID=1450533 RepID=UPI000D7EF324|nr:uncharacterized protein BO96DRAFT_501598 [Aspergillus niger CBS 101883]PYH55218.1 hypothetical protein BO96DRAFT_501598 [Aspergillus niger CBS 101883]GJP88411.1 putative integral membrane protein [Aspergillus niger]GKZ91419.1 hypothetical protein AnigIFM59636_003675 [Aspergillus niger]
MWTAIEQRDEASKAAYNSNVQLWTLYAIGCAVTLLRTYSQCKDLGWRRLRLDDYLIWVAILFYTAQVALAYSVGNVAHGLANNSMTEAQRATLDPGSAEYRERSVIQPRSGDWTLTDAVNRIIGSKIQIAGWATYTALINSLKLSMLVFYTRLMDGLGRRYRVPIWIGFALVIGSFVACMITILAACRPFNKNWQIYPDPGNSCQPAISKPVIAATFAANLATDPYLVLIPIPMLWKSSLKLVKKIAVTIVLGAGIFILVCATIKSVFLLVEPNNGASIADEWGTRETFVAVITTNLPMVFHLLRTWLARGFGSAFQSSQRTYQLPSGGLQNTGGGTTRRRGRGGTSSRDPITVGLTFTESEERMMQDIKLQTLEPHEAPTAGAIMVSNQIEVTHQTRNSHAEEPSAPRENANW